MEEILAEKEPVNPSGKKRCSLWIPVFLMLVLYSFCICHAQDSKPGGDEVFNSHLPGARDVPLFNIARSQVLKPSKENLKKQAEIDKQKIEASAPAGISLYEKSTVCIYGSSDSETFQSSGILISPDGLIITTAHDISRVQTVFVQWPNKEIVPGQIEIWSDLYDLALVSTHHATRSFIAVPKSSFFATELGTVINGLGCPYGLMGTLARGRITASPRMVGKILLLQSDLPAYPGNSGGPIFDMENNFVGLVKGRLRNTSDISFIIPGFYLNLFLQEAQQRVPSSVPDVNGSEKWVIWFNKGLAASKYDEKRAAFLKVLGLKPGFVPALYHLGLLYSRNMRGAKEEQRIWRHLIQLRPGWSEVWYRFGNALFKSGDFSRAENAYRRAIKLSSEDSRFYNNLGEIFRREKKMKKAEIYFRKALSIDPGYALAHYNLGILFDQELNKPELAVYHYGRYLKLRPDASNRKKVEKWIQNARKRF